MAVVARVFPHDGSKPPVWKHVFILHMQILQNSDFINTFPGLILSLRPANERRRYKVTPSLIGWVQT